MKADAQTLIPIGLVSLVVFRRVRKSIGFQPFRPKSMVVRMVFLGIIGLLCLGVSAFQPLVLGASGLGLIAGGILAFYAVRHLAQEWRGEKLFIRTHIVIESAVLALFLGRYFYRIVFSAPKSAPMPGSGIPWPQLDPLTMGFFFVILAYYFGYYGWLVLNREELLASRGGKREAGSGS